MYGERRGGKSTMVGTSLQSVREGVDMGEETELDAVLEKLLLVLLPDERRAYDGIRAGGIS